MSILGIETSCDDTGIAIIEAKEKKRPLPAKSLRDNGVNFKILSNIVSSQIKVHQKYGGVVPNLAAREHLKNIEPCLRQAFKEAGAKPKQIDLIAVTIGPGLIPSLLIGVHFAKALAYRLNKPIVPINHLEGHIVAAIAATRNKKQETRNKELFPAIALIVSGGHTQLVLVKKIGNYKILGETRDDAAGECFDKIAKLLRLGYPGGPVVAAEAAKSKAKSQKLKVNLPRPMINQRNYDFSFSGLKTAVLYKIRDMEEVEPHKFDVGGSTSHICAEVQQAIIDVLIEKTIRAAKEYKAKTVILSGGVAANKELRQQLRLNIKHRTSSIEFLTPSKILCTDNAAMIAMAGYFRYKSGAKTDWRKVRADANLRIS